jgi:hypothetical protein
MGQPRNGRRHAPSIAPGTNAVMRVSSKAMFECGLAALQHASAAERYAL